MIKYNAIFFKTPLYRHGYVIVTFSADLKEKLVNGKNHDRLLVFILKQNFLFNNVKLKKYVILNFIF